MLGGEGARGSEERSKGRGGKGGRAHIRMSSHPSRHSRASQRGPRPGQVSGHRARGGASRAAPARLHRRHLTRALRRPRRSEPGGPGPRSGRDIRREIGRRGRPLGVVLRRPASSGRPAFRLSAASCDGGHRIYVYALICHCASGVREANTFTDLYFGSCASTRSFRKWHGN